MAQSLRTLLACIALLLAAIPVWAQSSDGNSYNLTLDQALRRSLRYNPEIAKLDATLADKLGMAIETEVKINPGFKVTRSLTLAAEGTSNNFEVEFEQPLRPSDFGLRKTYAAALRAAANLEQQADLLRVLNGTAVLYYRLWTLQEREALLEVAQKDASFVVDAIEQQIAAGQSSISQQSIFQAEAARFGAELLATRGERSGAQGEMQRATGLAFRQLRLSEPQFGTVPDTFALARFAEQRAGLRQLALARRASAARNLDVARADGIFPEFAPGLIYSYSRGAKEAEAGFTIAGRLPLWDRNQGPVLRAQGALNSANRELTSFDRVSMDRLIESRRQQILNLEARLKSYRQEVLPAYRTAYDATLTQFRAGQATTLQLFEVQRSMIETREKALDYAVEAISARTQLEQLIGGRIEEVASKAPTILRADKSK
ncbi:TolC family protein [Verrucomicrobiota bacterium sgz303538]